VATADYRKSDSWKQAVELAPKLVALAEDLPASEEMGLSYRLKKIMVALPAAAAHDMLRGTDKRQFLALQLVATIDLIDRVYPALDTASVRADAQSLADMLMGDLEEAPAPPPVPAPPVHDTDPTPAPADVQVVPEDGDTKPAESEASEPAPAPTPASVQVAVQSDSSDGPSPAAD
jgi:hypothetical protein